MELLLERDALSYCRGHDAVRHEQWESAVAHADRPACILPWFELCHAVHHAAHAGRLDLDRFRHCWGALVERSEETCADGYVIHMLDSGGEAEALIDVLRLDPVATERELAQELEDAGDARGSGRSHHAHTARLRQLHERAVERMGDWGPQRLQWGTSPPAEGLDLARVGGPGLVLDTNVALELLVQLPLDGDWMYAPELPPRLWAASRSMVRDIVRFLEERGGPGKLIVPVSVLEEAGRVIQRKGGVYDKAGQVLEAMALASTWPMRDAFRFEPISIDIFRAFFALHEALVAHEVDPHRWPRFADALVMAHGIYNRCPVASTEWTEGREVKMDWEAVRHLFPFLVPPEG